MRYSFWTIYGTKATGVEDTDSLEKALRTAKNFELEVYDNLLNKPVYELTDHYNLNKDWITGGLNMEFNGMDYEIREVNINTFGDRLIAPKSLEDVLFSDDKYVSDRARAIDESIFFFVDDEDMNLDDDALAELVEANVL